jgi:hypothetical protein
MRGCTQEIPNRTPTYAATLPLPIVDDVLQIGEVDRLADALEGCAAQRRTVLHSGGTTAGSSPASLTTPMW